VFVTELVDQVAKPAVLIPGERIGRGHGLGKVLGHRAAVSSVVPAALRRLLAVLGVPAVFQVKGLLKKTHKTVIKTGTNIYSTPR